jgi:hypothetical protein
MSSPTPAGARRSFHDHHRHALDHVDPFICGERVVSVWMVTGTGADGERLNYRGCDIYEFRGDKILFAI